MAVRRHTRLHAQPADSARAELDVLIERSVVRRSPLRITPAGAAAVTGRVYRGRGDSIRVGRSALSLSGVEGVEVRRIVPDPLWNGVVAGAAAGAMAGLLFEGMLQGLGGNQQGASVVPTFGVLTGTGIGIAADASIVRRRWKVAWRRGDWP